MKIDAKTAAERYNAFFVKYASCTVSRNFVAVLTLWHVGTRVAIAPCTIISLKVRKRGPQLFVGMCLGLRMHIVAAVDGPAGLGGLGPVRASERTCWQRSTLGCAVLPAHNAWRHVQGAHRLHYDACCLHFDTVVLDFLFHTCTGRGPPSLVAVPVSGPPVSRSPCRCALGFTEAKGPRRR